MSRDEFTSPTKTKLARRAGYLCSHPECRRPTIGPAAGDDGVVNIGEAAHITAAAAGGPRYDASLSPDERRSEANGIWLCGVHAKQIDSDKQQFTVRLLRDWKTSSERRAFDALTTGRIPLPPFAHDIDLDAQVLERLGLKDSDPNELTHRIHAAARDDIASFQSTGRWPRHAIALTLSTAGSDGQSFDVAACALGIQASTELTLVAPPGTGKSTTAGQLVDAILDDQARVAVLVPLTEWSAQGDTILGSLIHRAAFRGFREQDFIFLALHGRLTLVLDAWNELDPASRRRALAEISRLRRDSPLLELAITTRRQALDVPISGPVIAIEPLSSQQQMEIARSTYGKKGEQRLDHAWRTPGLRDLVSIPLYLDALLSETTADGIPTTKEAVLRLFIQQHEQRPDNAEALRQGLDGLHADILAAVAVEATTSGNTALSDARARTIVATATTRLRAAGQISQEPQPAAVLDLLVNHHTLLRLGTNGGVTFQHQQIQEWYASGNVEALIVSAVSNEDSRQCLRKDILDVPAWEESILFACERLSRSDETGVRAVGACILETLTIDPILGAELIFRSAPEVWETIDGDVQTFVDRWHTKGQVDRAVRFMIATGRGEFSSLIWPLVTHPDDQVHLAALRIARRFRPSVLGPEAIAKLAALPEDIREHVISAIAHESGIDGMELAAEIAKTDPSNKIRVAVIDALMFRHSHRLVRDVLLASPDEVWSLVSRHSIVYEIPDTDIRDRLETERNAAVIDEGDLLRRLGMLLEPRVSTPETETAIAALLQSADFPIREQNGRWTIGGAFERYPDAVSTALVHRLAQGLELPFGTNDLLSAAATVDEGPIAELALRGEPKTAAECAVTLAGPQTVGILLDRLLQLHAVAAAEERRFSQGESDEHFRLSHLIERSRQASFVHAWLDRSISDDPPIIAALSDLMARHGGPLDTKAELQLDDFTRGQLEQTLLRWTGVLVSSLTSTRHQLAELARAIGRCAIPPLVEALNRLLQEDLARRQRAREAFEQARAQRRAIDRGDLAMSYVNLYRAAFAAIGGERVSEIVEGYLSDPDFGPEAASVLKELHDKRIRPKQKDQPLRMWPDFSEVTMRRQQRGERAAETTPEAEAILDASEQLMAAGTTSDQQRLALRLAALGLGLPHGEKAQLLGALLALTLPIRSKCELLTVLVMNGVVISADMVMDGIKAWLDEAQEKAWFREQGRWELERWLNLLPFSDRPSALLEALGRVDPVSPRAYYAHGLISALQHAPGLDVEQVLAEMARRKPDLLADHSWLNAILSRNTVSSCLLLLDLLDDPTLSPHADRLSAWHAADIVVAVMRSSPVLRGELLRRYETAITAASTTFIEHALTKFPDEESVMAMVRRKAANGTGFNDLLHMAIEHIALEQRPVNGTQGFYEIHSVDASNIRKRLFAAVLSDSAESALAARCLTRIDRLRDRHGRLDFEPRHPDIQSGKAWPLLQG